ncbi:unnamed protein product [Natator depressus]
MVKRLGEDKGKEVSVRNELQGLPTGLENPYRYVQIPGSSIQGLSASVPAWGLLTLPLSGNVDPLAPWRKFQEKETMGEDGMKRDERKTDSEYISWSTFSSK